MFALPSSDQPVPVTAPPPLTPPRLPDDSIVDLRFRALLGEPAWARLPPAVQKRFSKRLAPNAVVLYVGEVIETRLSRAGKLLAFLARIIGAPLPLDNGMAGSAVVAVTEDARRGGQLWTRTYARSSGRFPQVIHSAKCFQGPTGLEEHIGYGFGMSLAVSEESGALAFRSTRYFLAIGRFRLTLPRWIEPGAIEVIHRDEGGGAFVFSLALRHAWWGELISQTARFRDC